MLKDPVIQKRFLEYLEGFITENKRMLFDKVIEQRTRHITVVLEDIYQSQNASAVLRSCDCFGVQDVHIIENRYEYSINPDVALGSTKWLNLQKYNTEDENTQACYKNLREQGYQIIATTPHKDDLLLDELDVSRKTALVFGTELEGLSVTAIEQADAWVKIPMYGFTESFNISVSAAIILWHLTGKLRKSDIPWQLNDAERIETRLQWALSVVKHPDKHKRAFLIREGLG
ncbi:MAG: RNA methyltransferase [Bacteroidales bacterium]|jgi:tRNA (guanosine-2'-O-)-methyltransferase|nr:RNA methyltransferase [Bacteroidales bacterium]